jgi:prolyl 4-hydroxylase
MGVQQALKAGFEEKISDRIQEAREYMIRDFGRDPKKKRLLDLCKNKHADCAWWAVEGECEANTAYMTTNCAPVCHTCDQLDMSARCPIDLEKMPNAWKPGDVNRYFSNLTSLEEYKKYEPKVLSSPDYLPGDTEETADYIVGGPWVVVLENVLSEEEAQRLIELGSELGYEESFAGGKLLPDGTYERGKSSVRTSMNTWCERSCYRDPVAKAVIERVTNITQIPEENSEFLQASQSLIQVPCFRFVRHFGAH